MTHVDKSILVVSPEPALGQSIATALGSEGNVHVETRNTTLAQMNGSAVKIAADHDVILFQTDPGDAADMEAIRTLAMGRGKNTVLMALADGNISLSQVRALTQAGVDEVLPVSSTGEEIEGQIARLNRAVEPGRSVHSHQGQIIAVAQARGGVGSTTVAVNLADQLAGPTKLKKKQTRTKVALVDFDLQFGTVGSFLDLEEQDTLLQLALDGTIPDENFLKQSMHVMDNGMSVLPAPSKFAPLDSLRTDQVAAILESLQQTHDYVVVDMPRVLVGWVEAIIQRAEQVVMVTDVNVAAIRHCRRLIDFYTEDNVTLPIKILVNGEKKPVIRSSLHREAASVLERDLEYWLPHDAKAANAASDRGKPLAQASGRSHLNKAFVKLAKSIRSQTTPDGSNNKGTNGV